MLTKTLTTSLLALASLTSASPVKRQGRQFKFNVDEKVRGVNLGGWFVLEPWITPSIFESQPEWVVDEYTYCANNGGAEGCGAALDNHWKTWITEQDFVEIKNAGLNFVRIPLGYWSLTPINGEPYSTGAYKYVGPALDWAQGQGLKVMIDLHGAPGSQNGFDNSGKRGDILFGQGDSVKVLRSAIQKLRDDHASHPALASIQVVNEPMANVVGKGVVEQLTRDTWGDLSSTNLITSFHEGFLGVNAWDNTFDAGMDGLLTDTHHYEVFNADQLKLDSNGHNQAACSFGSQMSANRLWTISGEWTGAVTDCTKWLNGRGFGARYDGTFQKGNEGSSYIGSCDRKYQGRTADLSQEEKDTVRNFINAQLDGYEKAEGWIFWTWHTEGSPEWDMQQLLAEGLFPNPVTSRNGFRC